MPVLMYAQYAPHLHAERYCADSSFDQRLHPVGRTAKEKLTYSQPTASTTYQYLQKHNSEKYCFYPSCSVDTGGFRFLFEQKKRSHHE